MKVLLTGMSGVGKSTILSALETPDNVTIDLDYGGWIVCVDGERAIDVDRVLELFERFPEREVILAGTAFNQGKLYTHLDRVILLTAPLEVMRRRIVSRTNNPFGKSPQEWEKIWRDKAETEPLLLRGASHVVDTSGTIAETIARVRECMIK